MALGATTGRRAIDRRSGFQIGFDRLGLRTPGRSCFDVLDFKFAFRRYLEGSVDLCRGCCIPGCRGVVSLLYTGASRNRLDR